MTSPTRRYRGVPAEERRARRRAALLAAGLELLGTRGWAATTMRGVCGRAALNDRYFYESFADMDALLLAIVDDQAAEGTARILAAAENAPRRLGARTRAVVTAAVDFFTEDPRRARIMAHEFPANALLQERRQRIISTLADIFAAQAHEVLGEISVSPADLGLTALTVTAGLWELLAAWLRGDLEIDRDHLVDYVVAFVSSTTDLASGLERERR